MSAVINLSCDYATVKNVIICNSSSKQDQNVTNRQFNKTVKIVNKSL